MRKKVTTWSMDAKDEIIAQLQNDNALLKELVKQLQERSAVLEKNSSNSSKPPSSDITKPPQKSTPKDKKRKRGAPKGHKRNPRKPFEENQVDKIVDLTLNSCPTCGGKLVLSTETPKVHQQVELVDKPFLVTEYRQGWYWCEHCQCYHAAELPKDVAQAGLFGPKLVSLVACLKGGKASGLESLTGQDVDVFRLIDDPYGISANAAAKMAKAVSAGYSLRHAILAGLYSFFQFMMRPTQKECNRHGLHCSQAVSLAYRESGLDLWLAAPDWATLPEHLARSPFLVSLGQLEF